MNDNMMKNEVKYLREHLREIYQYKSSMADLTYDMPLELLSRCCIAFDYLQQELQRKDNVINELKEKINQFTLIIGYYDYNDEGNDEIGENNNLQEELLNIINLDKIKDIENGNK